MTAIGLDPSLRSLGLACPTGTLAVVPRNGVIGLARLRHLTDVVLAYAYANDAALVVIEGFLPAKAQAGVHERGGLWWRLVDQIEAADFPIATVTPGTLKMYATGKGNAGKDAMLLAAARRFDWFDGGNDESDALWLAAIGAELLGHPIVDMPTRNREALAGDRVTRI